MRISIAKKVALFLAAVVGSLGALVATAAPASAGDTYYPCSAMVSTVSPGTSYYQQAVTCVLHPNCGEHWGQSFYVYWYMYVDSGGVLVRDVTLRVIHTQGEDVTIGSKWVAGANTTYSINGVNIAPASTQDWWRNYNISPDTYFTKLWDGTIEFSFYTTSTKWNGCSSGWRQLRFILQVV